MKHNFNFGGRNVFETNSPRYVKAKVSLRAFQYFWKPEQKLGDDYTMGEIEGVVAKIDSFHEQDWLSEQEKKEVRKLKKYVIDAVSEQQKKQADGSGQYWSIFNTGILVCQF